MLTDMTARSSAAGGAPLLAALAVVLTWGVNFPLSKALFTQVGPAG